MRSFAAIVSTVSPIATRWPKSWSTPAPSTMRCSSRPLVPGRPRRISREHGPSGFQRAAHRRAPRWPLGLLGLLQHGRARQLLGVVGERRIAVRTARRAGRNGRSGHTTSARAIATTPPTTAKPARSAHRAADAEGSASAMTSVESEAPPMLTPAAPHTRARPENIATRTPVEPRGEVRPAASVPRSTATRRKRDRRHRPARHAIRPAAIGERAVEPAEAHPGRAAECGAPIGENGSTVAMAPRIPAAYAGRGAPSAVAARTVTESAIHSGIAER